MTLQSEDDDSTVMHGSVRVPVALSKAPESSLPTLGKVLDDEPVLDAFALPVGTYVAEFELSKVVGVGGFGIVYLAWDHSLKRRVALKEYMPRAIATRIEASRVSVRSARHRDTFEAGLRSFINEAQLLARFDHPALVKVYRFWQANGTAYMVMPFYEGRTLRDHVPDLPKVADEAWLLELLGPMTEVLAVMHREQCYHRDVAADNIVLLAESGAPLLLDFGAARQVIGDMTQDLTVILKEGYAPVEQYAELPGMKQGPWTDVYALAAVTHWVITGKTPPRSVGRMVSDTYTPLATAAAGRFSDRFLKALDRALAVKPDQRTQNMSEFRQDLGLDEGAPAASMAPGWVDPDATRIRVERPVPDGPAMHRRPARWPVAAGASVLLLSVVGGYGLWRGSAQSELTSPPQQKSQAPPELPPPVAATPSESPIVGDRPAPPAASEPLPREKTSLPESVAHPAQRLPAPDLSPRAQQVPVVAVKPPDKKSGQTTARPPPTGQAAECARLLQRQSLGDMDPALQQRSIALGCK